MSNKKQPEHRIIADRLINYLRDSDEPCEFSKNEKEVIRDAFKRVFKLGQGTSTLVDKLDKGTGKDRSVFVWLTHDGERKLPQQMATPHLFYALRMIWNHSVPEFFRIPGTTRYPDVPHWSKEYRLQAIDILEQELLSRDYQYQLDAKQLKELNYMQRASLFIPQSSIK